MIVVKVRRIFAVRGLEDVSGGVVSELGLSLRLGLWEWMVVGIWHLLVSI